MVVVSGKKEGPNTSTVVTVVTTNTQISSSQTRHGSHAIRYSPEIAQFYLLVFLCKILSCFDVGLR